MVRRVPCLLLFSAALTLSAGAVPAEPLWLNAVASAARAKEWSPGEMRLAIEMADDKGTVLDTWDNRYRLFLDAEGVVRTEVVSVTRNGKDETRKEREAQAKRDAQAKREAQAKRDGGAQSEGESAWAGFLDDPFDPAKQGAVTIRPLAGTSVIAGTNCVAFSFTLSKSDDTAVEGTAWLDAATGLPVEVVSSPKPLPRAVHELVTTVRYTDGLVSEVRVAGSGSLLFLKRRFSSIVTLGSWFRLPGG